MFYKGVPLSLLSPIQSINNQNYLCFFGGGNEKQNCFCRNLCLINCGSNYEHGVKKYLQAGLCSNHFFRADSTLTHIWLTPLWLIWQSRWLNSDSNSKFANLTQLWLKWRSAWFDYISTHILDFHGRLDSDSTHLSQSWVKFDSRHMSRAQPCLQVG